MAKQPLLLMILDGWGIAPAGQYNAAALAKTPNLDALFDKYPHTRLSCSGAAVGLPDGQMGNSEVGHLNIGAGRIVYQELTRITKAIKDGDFFENTVLSKAMQTVKANGSALHLLGLVSDGGVHSHISHLFALLEMAKRQGLNKVYVHAFLDGRDVGPQTADVYLAELDAETKRIGVGKIATVAGRYYAMDRDKRWERVQKAYDAMVLHDGTVCTDAVSGVRASYAGGVTDEFVVPFIAAPEADSCVKAGDGMIFFNFRPDRARQLTRAFVDEEFPYFARPQTARPVNFVCMTQYDETIKAPVAFAPETLEDTLKLIKNAGAKCGAVINPDTPVSAVEKVIPLCDMVLVMSVFPGFGGQKFIADVLDKVREIREIIRKNNLSCDVEIDGGINAETVKLAKAAGANVIVAGSGVFKAENRAAAIEALRNL